jgi:hypothetical protein
MKPRIGSILWTDWPALVCLMSFPVIWLICAQLPFVRRDGGFGMHDALAIALPLSLVAGGLLAWRIVRIHGLFSRGQLVRARVTRVDTTADRCRLEFAYDFAGMRLTSWTSVYRNMQVQALQVNQEIEVLVDATRPDNAIVRQLYV